MTIRVRDAFITLASTQLDRLVEFYSRLLTTQPTTTIPGKYAEYQLPGLRLAIFQPSDRHRAEFERPDGAAMSLCLEVEDLYSAIAHINAMGYPAPGDIVNASHGRETYAYDPDGNRLILHQSHE
jgi:predicted enzyme related to lactoylglutathione lyase